MEGRKKERVMAGAVCVLVILLSAQRLPVGVADPTSPFCQCYAGCYKDCKATNVPLPQDCNDYCCAGCYFPGNPDFENGCGKSGGKQASICGSEATGDDTEANYWRRSHGKAKAKHVWMQVGRVAGSPHPAL